MHRKPRPSPGCLSDRPTSQPATSSTRPTACHPSVHEPLAPSPALLLPPGNTYFTSKSSPGKLDNLREHLRHCPAGRNTDVRPPPSGRSPRPPPHVPRCSSPTPLRTGPCDPRKAGKQPSPAGGHPAPTTHNTDPGPCSCPGPLLAQDTCPLPASWPYPPGSVPTQKTLGAPTRGLHPAHTSSQQLVLENPGPGHLDTQGTPS